MASDTADTLISRKFDLNKEPNSNSILKLSDTEQLNKM